MDRTDQFVQEYLKDFNACAAAERMGYTPASARTMGSRFLRSAQVRRRLAEIVGFGGNDPQNRVLQELRSVAFGQGSDQNGAPIKMASKLKALELLGKHMGLFEPGAKTQQPQVTILEDL